MNKSELEQEIAYGLENLNKVYERIRHFSNAQVDNTLKMSALTYECFGYYNAVEHLFIRFIKHLNLEMPTGAFSHRDTFRLFEMLLFERQIEINADTIRAIAELMAFRHVATRIYGFLIDEAKLNVIIVRINAQYTNITLVVQQLLTNIDEVDDALPGS